MASCHTPKLPPKVSVVSSVYNAAPFLEEAIESVLAQEYQDFELLLVDDGSSDGSTEIAKRYAHKYRNQIIYLNHDGHANRGCTASRNVGLRAARGDFLAFIDADDRWRPAKLREQVEILDALPQVDAVCGAVNFWGSANGGEDRIVLTGHSLNRPIPPGEATLALYPLGKAAPPCPSDLIVRRKVVEAIGGFEESFVGPLQMYEDQAFFAKLYLKATIFFADKVWLDYRVHDASCSSRVTREGLYPQVRLHFLYWFKRYLATTEHWRRLSIRIALARALLPYWLPRGRNHWTRRELKSSS